MKMENIVNGWREAVKLPVITTSRRWSLQKLDAILDKSIFNCVQYCMSKNNGVIYTTLSGGIDSSICLAKIRKLFPGAVIHAFTCGAVPHNPCLKVHPDVFYASRVAKRFGAIHHVFQPTDPEIKFLREEFRDLFPEARKDSDAAYFSVYKYVASFRGVKTVIVHDGIDELLGGYWEHRKYVNLSEKEVAFRRFWSRLEPDHLIEQERAAQLFGIEVIHPYLQVDFIRYVSKIPVEDRTSHEIGKMPFKVIAKSEGVPASVIQRRKIGFCSALERF